MSLGLGVAGRPIGVVAGLLTALTCVGCVHGEVPSRALGAPAGWSAVLPSAQVGWRAFATVDTVLALGQTPADAEVPEQTLVCFDPLTGVVRWRWRGPGSSGRVLLTGGRVVVVSAGGLVGLDEGSGATVWSLDPGEQGIGDALVSGNGQLVVSLAGELLVVLDAQTGEWLRAVAVPKSRLQVIWHNLAVIGVDPSHSGWSRPALLAIDLDSGGSVEPPYPEATVAWRAPVVQLHTPLWEVNDKLIGELGRQEVWGLDADTGKIAWRQPLRLPAVGHRGRRMRRATGWRSKRARHKRVTAEDLAEDIHLGFGQRPFGATSSLVLVQGAREGLAMKLVRIDAHQPADFTRRWSLSVPGREPFVVAHPLRDRSAVLLVRRTEARLVDLQRGATLASWRLGGAVPWVDVTFARGLIVVSEDGGRASTIESRSPE